MATNVFERAVIGGGPVGIVAGLQLSRQSPTALALCRVPDANAAPRLEVVPAGFIATLVELGVHPRRIGVDRLHNVRHLAWEHREAQTRNGPPAAYVERPALD